MALNAEYRCGASISPRMPHRVCKWGGGPGGARGRQNKAEAASEWPLGAARGPAGIAEIKWLPVFYPYLYDSALIYI
jgi:hypothetical protein